MSDTAQFIFLLAIIMAMAVALWVGYARRRRIEKRREDEEDFWHHRGGGPR